MTISCVTVLTLHGSVCCLLPYAGTVNPSAHWLWFNSQTVYCRTSIHTWAPGFQNNRNMHSSLWLHVAVHWGQDFRKHVFVNPPLSLNRYGRHQWLRVFTGKLFYNSVLNWVGVKGYLAAKELTISSQYNVPWRGHTEALLPCLSLPALPLWPPLAMCIRYYSCVSASLQSKPTSAC